jgi:hypothetical protein
MEVLKMVTIDDLKISIDCWGWICDKSETWEFTYDGTEPAYCKSRVSGFAFYFNEPNRESLESLIYQAIDETNSETAYFILQGYVMITLLKNDCAEKCIIYSVYDSKTTARLAALQWIHQKEQEAKNAE